MTEFHTPEHLPIPISSSLSSVIPPDRRDHHSNGTIQRPMSKPNRKGMKLLQPITNRFRKSLSIVSSSTNNTTNTENYDYIVEFEHCHGDHSNSNSSRHITFPTTTATTSIPPFRIISPAQDDTTTTTTKANHLKRSNATCSNSCCCSGKNQDGTMRGGIQFLLTKLRNSSSSSSSRANKRRMPRVSPTTTTTASSQSTLQTLNTTSSSNSSCCSTGTNGVEEKHTNESIGPINEYGDCRKADELDMVVVAVDVNEDDGNVVGHRSSTGRSTTPTTGTSTTAQMMMDISDQYYCIGKHYQYELCQPQLALQYYYNAYHTALQCYRNVVPMSSSSKSIRTTARSNHRDVASLPPLDAAATTTAAASSAASLLLLEEIQGQIQLTKECIGRIHFELGNIEEALQML